MTRIFWLPYVVYKVRKYGEKDSRLKWLLRILLMAIGLQFYWGLQIAKMALISD